MAGADDMRITELPTTLREIALERLRTAIIEARFKPGERLTEAYLCDLLGVSRSVIREVLRHLEAEHLVVSVPHHGPTVAKLDRDSAVQIYDLRALLEGAAAKACAEHATKAQIDAIGKALEAIRRAYEGHDPRAVLTASQRFYQAIFTGAGHGIAWEIVQRINGRISQLRALTIAQPGRSTSGPVQLGRIFEAIEARDGDRASAACHDHVRAAAETALAKIAELEAELEEAAPAKPARQARRPRTARA
ncbi:GntR family transcriptional regulator [Sphingomonas oryzagri]|uniref:GntR family transcriptional regulator n=1 Tax=Sphingomonas oryzagri TaxID=3042314 RepID=A0ABT6N202_9SPHN|nr:GntR family transcriptional regulator [Sphingomonas oryzagri]MDH7639122.1 GntR family transcriptional regulator [Sphingomonas oryzagri]